MLGFIGVGGMGTGLLNIFKGFPDVRIAAVCDAYEPHARQAQSAAEGRPDVEHDFRKVLDRKDIDAVVINTPDHWHAIPTILACQAGKDVYCEKPLTHRIAEGRAVVTAAEKHKRVTQMGNLIHAGENYHRVVEIVRSGVLGTISKTRVWMAADLSGMGKPADGDPPAGCDYDFWLGPAPKRAFNPNRFTFNWRWFWDYGGGLLTDFCCHIVDPVHWAMEVDAPWTITVTGGRFALVDNGETQDTLQWSATGRLNVLPGTTIEKTIVCPKTGEQRVQVSVHFDWPDHLPRPDLGVIASLRHQGLTYQAPLHWSLSDPNGSITQPGTIHLAGGEGPDDVRQIEHPFYFWELIETSQADVPNSKDREPYPIHIDLPGAKLREPGPVQVLPGTYNWPDHMPRPDLIRQRYLPIHGGMQQGSSSKRMPWLLSLSRLVFVWDLRAREFWS